MEISVLFDAGDAKVEEEDAHVVALPFVGMADGVSDAAVTGNTKDPAAMAADTFRRLDVGGLRALLDARRACEARRDATAHTSRCELTALHVRFS